MNDPKTPASRAELTKRLRDQAAWLEFRQFAHLSGVIEREAADALDAQASEIERLRKECRWRMGEMNRLARERDEAVETKNE